MTNFENAREIQWHIESAVEAHAKALGLSSWIDRSNVSMSSYTKIILDLEDDSHEFVVRISDHGAKPWNGTGDFNIHIDGQCDGDCHSGVSASTVTTVEEFENEFDDCDDDGEPIIVKFTDTREVEEFVFDESDIDAAIFEACAAIDAFAAKHKA